MAIGFDEIEEGQAYTTARRTITEADIVNFAGFSGDFNPLHMDDVFAKEATPYGRRVAHGLVGLSIATGLRSEMDDWYVLGWLEVQRRFEGPVFAGDTIHAEAVVKSKRRSRSKPDRGIVVLTVKLVNQTGAVVQSGEDTVLMGTATGEL
jgi:acyl dehydratase